MEFLAAFGAAVIVLLCVVALGVSTGKVRVKFSRTDKSEK
jgi:hypothetical protein